MMRTYRLHWRAGNASGAIAANGVAALFWAMRLLSLSGVTDARCRASW